MSNIYAGALGEIGALLGGGDRLLQDKFKSTETLYRLVMDEGFSPQEAQELVNKTRPDRLKNVKSVGKQTLGQLDEAADMFGTQGMLEKGAKALPKGTGIRKGAKKLATGAVGKNIARAVPIIGAGFAVADAGDIVFGQDSFANKAMDTGAMGIGGVIGGVLGMGNPFAVAAGASTGKMVSDGLQYLFGDKKSAEQRKMEEALAMLNSGRYM